MRRFILTALLVCVSVEADTLAFLENKTGGVIVLTDDKTKCSRFPGAAYATDGSNNRTFWGCWYSDDMRVFIDWHDGDKTSYLLSNFTHMTENIRRWVERKKANTL